MHSPGERANAKHKKNSKDTGGDKEESKSELLGESGKVLRYAGVQLPGEGDGLA